VRCWSSPCLGPVPFSGLAAWHGDPASLGWTGRRDFTGPGGPGPPEPPGRIPGSGSGGAETVSAGSAAQDATATITDVGPGVSSGNREIPRVLSVEHGVFLSPRKRRRRTSPQDSGKSGKEDVGTEASASGGIHGPSDPLTGLMECEVVSPHSQPLQERREGRKQATPPPPSKIPTPGSKEGQGMSPNGGDFLRARAI